MCILAALPDAAKLNVKVLATDIDPVVIEKCLDADYSAEDLAAIPAGLRDRFFDPVGGSGKRARVGQAVRDLVTFGTLNLIEPLPFHGPFDVIFCRNVAIYFDAAAQAKVWSNLHGVLIPNGYLFIGHSERLSGPTRDAMHNAGPTTYVKTDVCRA